MKGAFSAPTQGNGAESHDRDRSDNDVCNGCLPIERSGSLNINLIIGRIIHDIVLFKSL